MAPDGAARLPAMIEQILIFLLGVLTAALCWLVLLPAFWRRATRLARANLVQSMPISPNEIAAEQDRLRAEQAIEIGRMRHRIETMQAEVSAAKSETGERLQAESRFLDTIEQGRRRIAELEAVRENLEADVARLTANLSAVTEARDSGLAAISALESQRETLTTRLNAAVDLAEKRRIELDDTARHLAEKSDALADETMRATNLRLEKQTVDIHLREAERQLAELTALQARYTAANDAGKPANAPQISNQN